jgi:hypothetical protein
MPKKVEQCVLDRQREGMSREDAWALCMWLDKQGRLEGGVKKQDLLEHPLGQELISIREKKKNGGDSDSTQ